jgi:hypothetical protein
MVHHAKLDGTKDGQKKRKKTEKYKSNEVLKSYLLLKEVIFSRRNDLSRMLTYFDS